MLNGRKKRNNQCLANVGLTSLLLAIMLFTGCVVGPDYVRPETKINENWNEKDDHRIENQAVNAQWWQTFDDATLNKLIQLAYKQNLPLQIAGIRILESRALLGIAIGQQYPQLQELSASAINNGRSKNAPNGLQADRHHWSYDTGFDTAWELDFWGKYRRAVESEKAGLFASMADYDDTLVLLTAEVARTYTVIRTNEVLIELAKTNAQIQEEGLRIAESRFRNGATTELDVMQARTLLASTKATIPQLEINLQQAENALSTLLGETTGKVQALLNENKGIPAASNNVAVGVPAELLRRRPDVRSAELNAVAQSARIGIAKADFYPSFSLTGSIGVQTSSRGGALSNNAHAHNLFDKDSIFYSFGPTVQWPILNYGRIANNVRVQDARFQELLVNYQNTVLLAAQEVEDGMIGFLKSQEKAVYEQNSVDAGKRSVEIALAQYREGAVDYQRVLDTQRSLLQEENNLAQTRSAIATNLISLYKALGGGWELRNGDQVVAENIQNEMRRRTNWDKFMPITPLPENLETPASARDIPILQQPNW
ncbi:MAG: transporter [Planctomycetes bacterium GWF2_42_9]|nr:MAG: transporter [Planctomycetes bacterium GWF2_42_9]HAL44787.1 transporter [Phycisphaerales bacterium]